MSLIVNPYRFGSPSHRVAKFISANSEYLSIADATQSGLDTTGSFTLVYWAKFSDPGTDGEIEAFTRWNHPGDKSWRIAFQDNGGFGWKPYLQLSNNNKGTAPTGGFQSYDTWVFNTVCYDTVNDKAIFWQDNFGTSNLSENTGNFSLNSIPAGDADFLIGTNMDFDSYLDASLAFVGFYNAVLSSSTIQSLYNSGTPKTYTDLTSGDKTSLVSWWNLSEASGSRVDSHGSNDLADNNTVGSEIWTP